MAHPHAIAATATALLHLLARDCPRSAFLSDELLGLSPGSTAGESFLAGESLTLLVDTLSPEDRHPLSAVDGGQWLGAVPCAVKGLRLEHVTTESKPR